MPPLFETIIGLTFIFMIFSLVTSWIVEFLSMLLQRRGNMLHDYLKKALDDNFNKNWGLMLYAHPLIEALGREIPAKGFFSWLHNNTLGYRRRLPQYIPADQFAITFIDLIMTHKKQAVFIRNEDGIQSLAKEDFTREGSLEQFVNNLNSLEESELKNTLIALSRVALHKPQPFIALHHEIETWYTNSMDRLNGWYKRATRKWLFWIGLIVAVLFNVNTIEVITRMYTDPQMRAATLSVAEQIIREDMVNQGRAINPDSLKDKVAYLRTKLSPLNLPIGYDLHQQGGIEGVSGKKVSQTKGYYDFAAASVIGWLITALALSFGAPFWFDALKSMVNIRSSGLSPANKKV